MPMPILCLDDGLRQYVTAFAAVFTPAQAQHLVTVLLGLVLAPERRTLSGLRGKVAGAGSLSALSRFVACAPGRRPRWPRPGRRASAPSSRPGYRPSMPASAPNGRGGGAGRRRRG